MVEYFVSFRHSFGDWPQEGQHLARNFYSILILRRDITDQNPAPTARTPLANAGEATYIVYEELNSLDIEIENKFEKLIENEPTFKGHLAIVPDIDPQIRSMLQARK